MSRTQNSLRNIAFGLTGQILNIIMSFAMRTVFIHTLSDIYLGINGTFTDILMLFSLADLGVGTAMFMLCTNRSPSRIRTKSRRL